MRNRAGVQVETGYGAKPSSSDLMRKAARRDHGRSWLSTRLRIAISVAMHVGAWYWTLSWMAERIGRAVSKGKSCVTSANAGKMRRIGRVKMIS
jgi:hypothetical protein